MAIIERRKKDLQSLNELKQDCSRFDFQVTEGQEAPTRYRISFRCATYLLDGGAVKLSTPDTLHEVDLYLGTDYPFKPPEITWKTKIFHPNILPTGPTCILGGLWDPRRSLRDVCIQLIEMAAYQNYDAHHPLAGAKDAAEWILAQPIDHFPADRRKIIDRQ